DTEFTRQLQSVEEYNKTLSDEIKFPKYNVHKGAVYTSRLLPTKEITQLLQSSQLSNGFSQTDISRPVDDISISLTEPMENLNIQEKQVQNSPQAQIQIPPK
ncbi:27585_t:CDS:1, partial [Racocetra persica]